jgi:RimJ/RimL family protein N-acetyltransferase
MNSVAACEQSRHLISLQYPSITSKSGQKDSEVKIRQASPNDSLVLHALFNQLDRETPYLGFVPGERSPQAWEIQRQIIEDTSGNKGAIFIAYHLNEAVGFLQAQICPLQRLRHILIIEIGIRQNFTGHGIGKQLFKIVEDGARMRQVHRLELTVATCNERALALYRKCGFSIKGIKRHAMLLDGSYVDDYLMAKLLT